MTSKDNPGSLVSVAVSQCLEITSTWLAWDGRPRVTDGENLWTPHKAPRRITVHVSNATWYAEQVGRLT